MNSFPSHLSMVVRQTRYQLKYFTRIPVALFFTVILPLVMLVLFSSSIAGFVFVIKYIFRDLDVKHTDAP